MASIGYNGSPHLRPKLQNAKKFLSLQLSQTGHAISSEFNSMMRGQALARKRRKVINEIFTTEKTYQEHLDAITTYFLAPLKVACLLPSHALNTIFSNIENIQAINRELLNHMEDLGVADAFLALAPFIKLYSTYANNFGQASVTLQVWEKKSPEFLSFKTKQESLPNCKGLNLEALLITPVQRVPRYKLLLESLLNKTSQDHADFEKLHDATYEINKVASHINENIRQHENFQKMLSIQKSLTGEGAPKILAPGRLFIREGPLLKACSNGSQSQERMFFLFSDILLYGKKNSSLDKDQCTYTCRRVLPLIDCDVKDLLGHSTESETPRSDTVGALFKVTCKDKCLLLYSTSKHEATSWFRDIGNAIREVQKCRASLKPRRESGLGTTGVPPLKRSAFSKRYQRASNKKENDAKFASPKIRVKDTLYPMRREFQARVSSAIKLTPLRRSAAKNKETMINSPWTHPSGAMTRSQDNKQTAISGVMTRAQKRKRPLEENKVLSLQQTKKLCFRPKVNVTCVRAVRSPLKSRRL